MRPQSFGDEIPLSLVDKLTQQILELEDIEFSDQELSRIRGILSQMDNVVFGGGGGKGLVYPEILDTLRGYGFPSKLKKVVGISVGCFEALAFVLGIQKRAEAQTYLVKMPVETFKVRTFKRTFRFILRILQLLLPRKWRTRLESSFNWAFYDTGGMREFVRESIVNKIDAWRREESPTHKKDPTFQELYEHTAMDLVFTGTVAETQETVFFSRHTTPNTPVSLALVASTSIPGVYPPVDTTAGLKIVDGGLTASMHDFKEFSLCNTMHIILNSASSHEIWTRQNFYIDLPNASAHLERLFGRFYSSDLKNFPDELKDQILAVMVPSDTLNYDLAPEEQALNDLLAKIQIKVFLKKLAAKEAKCEDSDSIFSQQPELTQSTCLSSTHQSELHCTQSSLNPDTPKVPIT